MFSIPTGTNPLKSAICPPHHVPVSKLSLPQPTDFVLQLPLHFHRNKSLCTPSDHHPFGPPSDICSDATIHNKRRPSGPAVCATCWDKPFLASPPSAIRRKPPNMQQPTTGVLTATGPIQHHSMSSITFLISPPMPPRPFRTSCLHSPT
jgi:hypothetical protein